MPGTDEATETDQSALGAHPADSQQPVTTAPPATQERVHTLKDGDFKKIKDEAKRKGREEASAEIASALVDSGFNSMAEALAALKKLSERAADDTREEPTDMTTQPRPKKTATPPAKQPAPDKLARQQAHLAAERDKLKRQWRTEEKKRRDLQRQLDAKDAEMELRTEMFGAGVKDVDYGLRLLTRALAGKTPDEMAKFDRKAFFEGLRGEKPYLFGETVAAATTGTVGAPTDDKAKAAAAGAPGTPPAGKVAGEAATAERFDARSAKPAEVEARLRKLGLNPHQA